MLSKKRLLLIVASFLPIVLYFKLFGGFFQQDEWYGYSQYVLHKDLTAEELLMYFITPSVGHYTPLTIPVVHALFSFFGLNYQAFVLVSLVLHGVNLLLFLYLTKILFKNVICAVLATITFALLASHFQGTAWVIANISTHTASIFGLLSIIFFFKLLDTKKIRNLYISLTAFIVSLLFKEITIGLFFLMTLAIFIFRSKTSFEYKRWMSLTTLVFVGYILVRLLLTLSPVQIKDTTVFATQSTPKLMYNVLTLPFKAISQSILPQGQIRALSETATLILSEKLTGEKGSPAYEIFVVKKSMEIITLAISFSILIISLYVFARRRNEYYVKVGVFGLAWILLNSAVFSLAPEREGIISTIDSRYLYFVSMGTSVYLISMAMLVTRGNMWKVIQIVVLIASLNTFWLNKELNAFTQRGRIRKETLDQMKAAYPTLPQKVVFYTESDKSYYGLPPTERIIPFQSGLGQTLLASYYQTEKFPKKFFEEKFLWDILSQGYDEDESRGFGYFRDFSKLAQAVKDQKLNSENVIAFSYSSKDSSLEDITQDVRGRLEAYLSPRYEISISTAKASASHNSRESSLAVDGNLDSKWDSRTPYSNPQNFQIDLPKAHNLSQIILHSNGNRDQNETGYDIELSLDGNRWVRVYHAIRNTPGENSQTYIYFKPTDARFIRINQIGEHKFASWVIYELNLYETSNK